MRGLPISVLAVFVLAAIAPIITRSLRGSAGWALATVPAAIVVYLLLQIPAIADGELLRSVAPWVPSMGVAFSFALDGLSLSFALLIAGIGALVLAYAGGYLAGNPYLPRFYATLLAFMGAMLGLVLADNVITLFVFWELTSLTSYLLIGFDHESEKSRKAALQALLVTGLGGLALLAGVLLLGHVAGSYELSRIVESGDVIRAHPLYLPMLLLVLCGAFTKSAQFPFHFWLPNAMAAPTPVSAYLHSATMVKAGIYLLARTHPALGGTEAWYLIVGTAGLLTMVIGAVLALRQTDLKLVLAYSTVMALGTLTLMLGLGTTTTAKAAVVFLIVHSLYKGALFLVVGAIDHETGTREVDRLGGLRKVMPITAVAAVLAGLSMAGIFPLLGFVGKEVLYEATIGLERGSLLFTGAAVFANALVICVTGLVSIRPFFGVRPETPKSPHEAPLSMWLGPMLLASAGLVMGLYPTVLVPGLVAPAVGAITRTEAEIYLHLWPGLAPALGLSAITLLAGVLAYFAWERLHGGMTRLDRALAWGPARWYEHGLSGLTRLAEWQTALIQTGYLRDYVRGIFLAALVLLGGTAILRQALPSTIPAVDVTLYELTLAGLILLAALSAVRATSRLAAIVSLGVVGYSIALLFVEFGAPDLAMTQFLVETLVVIIVALVLVRVPRFSQRPEHFTVGRVRDLAVAIAVGVLITSLVLAVSAMEPSTHVSDYFAEQSYPGGHGRNVVNVILVDFRALDTLGEIMVLAVAGLGVTSLIKLRLGVRRREERR